LNCRASVKRLSALLLPFAASASLGASLALSTPQICGTDQAWNTPGRRLPPEVSAYFDSLDGGSATFDIRAACANWAAMDGGRRKALARSGRSAEPPAARFIIFPAPDLDVRQLGAWLTRNSHIHAIERARNYLVVTFARGLLASRLHELLSEPRIEYAEPDCDGPDFLTTSLDLLSAGASNPSCWQRAARAVFPNDPCIEELWGHSSIGWDSGVAARSLPRVVAVLDSGIDASHEDLAINVIPQRASYVTGRSQGSKLNAQCATSGRCYPHGTEMAGTIAGRMDNGIGVAGVAPNSLLMPIVISRVDRGLLARLSTIAMGIDSAVLGDADVINISAKWPVDSRAISEAILAAVGGNEARRRLVVTGYTTTLRADDTVVEYFPSRYRCLPGVIAAVPTDMRGRNLSNTKGHPKAEDGRLQAPGVDIVVTTTENSERGYALSEAAGPSSAAAYVSGTVALVWGSPPLNKCDAQQIKRLLFCRSKSSESTRYPWVNVEFLRELANVDPAADCPAAMETLGCN
jgi:subtilisin family serine protease